MTVKIGGATTRSFNFQLLPKKIKIANGQSNRIDLAALPLPPFFSPNAELLASLKNSKKKIKVSSNLSGLLKTIGWDIAKLKPLSTYLKNVLDQSKTDPSVIVGLLSTFLKSGCLPDFKVKITPQVVSSPPLALSLNLSPEQVQVVNFELIPDLLLTQVQSINFELIPREVKTRNGRVKVTLAAILSIAGADLKARVLATLRHGKRELSYSKRLKAVLEQINWTVSDLKPLKKFLNNTLKAADKDPKPIVEMLTTYLKSGVGQNFALKNRQGNGKEKRIAC